MTEPVVPTTGERDRLTIWKAVGFNKLVGQRHRKLVESNQVWAASSARERSLLVFRMSAKVDVIATFKPEASQARELRRRQNRPALPMRRNPVGVDVRADAAR